MFAKLCLVPLAMCVCQLARVILLLLLREHTLYGPWFFMMHFGTFLGVKISGF